MKQQISMFDEGYLVLMMGIGVNPVITTCENEQVIEFQPVSLKEMMVKAGRKVTSHWDLEKGMRWQITVEIIDVS